MALNRISDASTLAEDLRRDKHSYLVRHRATGNEDVLDLEDLKIKIEFDYYPAARNTLDYPGHASYVEISSIQIQPEGYSGWLLTDLRSWDLSINAIEQWRVDICERFDQ